MKNSFFRFLLSATALIALCATCSAQLLYGSPSSNDLGGYGYDASRTLGAVFSLPGQDYSITKISLRLSDFDPADRMSVGIYEGNTTAFGALVGQFVSPQGLGGVRTNY